MGSQVEDFARAHGPVRDHVDLQIADHMAGRMIRKGRAPDQGLQSCAQLAEGEGLDQVVVGPGVQPGHPVIDRSQGRQH
ncbi:hypothetical protein D3C80_2131430 [compost metagenome]